MFQPAGSSHRSYLHSGQVIFKDYLDISYCVNISKNQLFALMSNVIPAAWTPVQFIEIKNIQIFKQTKSNDRYDEFIVYLFG